MLGRKIKLGSRRVREAFLRYLTLELNVKKESTSVRASGSKQREQHDQGSEAVWGMWCWENGERAGASGTEE